MVKYKIAKKQYNNMRCEICGSEAGEKPLNIKLDGSMMKVCEKCSKYGAIQKEAPEIVRKRAKNVVRQSNNRVYSSKYNEPKDDLVEDYNILIREKREKLKLSREELGKKIYEKVSVITRVESGKMVPDIKLVRKIEKALNIDLVESLENSDFEYHSKNLRKATLGDLVKIKKK
ncbi:MAG: multiprotein bridging factor aMBF1 [Methanobacteriaceae archaeon]